MTEPIYCIDIKKMCDIKGPFYASFLNTDNIFVACNKLKLDFCHDIYGKQDVIGNTPSNLLGKENEDAVESCYLENEEIIQKRVPKQFYHTWMVKRLYRLDLLTFKIPIFSITGEIAGVFSVSHFINKFSVEKAFKLGLSNRETECLFYLLEGYTAKEIARTIKLSPRTIEGYIENMKDKLNCSTTSEVLLKALHSEVKEGFINTLTKSLPLDKFNPLSEGIKNTFSSVSINLV